MIASANILEDIECKWVMSSKSSFDGENAGYGAESSVAWTRV